MVAKIEDALSQMVPILIGFIASVLGIGGIGEKIRSIVQKLQKPVNKALDFVIKTGLKLAGPVIRGLKGIGAKAKAKVAAGKAYVKGKVEAGKAVRQGKVAGVRRSAHAVAGSRLRCATPTRCSEHPEPIPQAFARAWPPSSSVMAWSTHRWLRARARGSSTSTCSARRTTPPTSI